MYINEYPKQGDKLYYCFLSYRRETLLYVEIKKIWLDKTAYSTPRKVITAEIIKVLTHPAGESRIGEKVVIDSTWHLQKTLSDCKRVILLSLFNYGIKGFWKDGPPWDIE